MPGGIVSTLRTAIEDYGEFPTEALGEAVLKALAALDTDLTENGYVPSEKAEQAAAVVETEMNEADVVSTSEDDAE